MRNDTLSPETPTPTPAALPRRRSSRAAVAAGVFAFVVLGAGIAMAVVPNGNTFNACRNKTSFLIRVIDPSAGQTCTVNETAINWKTWKWRGAWTGTASYFIGDAVSNGGQSYTAIANSLNKAPATNPTIWSLLAAKGAPGPAGKVTGLGTGTNLAGQGPNGQMCTLGEISLFAGNQVSSVASVRIANGALLPISQNTALFSLLGTTYGGDGVQTFALPNLTALAPNHMTYTICVDGLFP